MYVIEFRRGPDRKKRKKRIARVAGGVALAAGGIAAAARYGTPGVSLYKGMRKIGLNRGASARMGLAASQGQLRRDVKSISNRFRKKS